MIYTLNTPTPSDLAFPATSTSWWSLCSSFSKDQIPDRFVKSLHDLSLLFYFTQTQKKQQTQTHIHSLHTLGDWKQHASLPHFKSGSTRQPVCFPFNPLALVGCLRGQEVIGWWGKGVLTELWKAKLKRSSSSLPRVWGSTHLGIKGWVDGNAGFSDVKEILQMHFLLIHTRHYGCIIKCLKILTSIHRLFGGFFVWQSAIALPV